MRMQLSLDTLKDFDAGKGAVAFEKCLARVVLDCLDRPGDKTARKVTMTVEVVPIMQQDGDVIDADVRFVVKSSVPAWTTAGRPLAVDRQGRLIFNDMAPDNPHQTTIDEATEPE